MKALSKIKQLKDLTEKIDEIEQRRSINKNNNKFILDYNVDGLLVADKNLSIEFCNPALLKLLNYKPEELAGTKDVVLVEMREGDDPEGFLAGLVHGIPDRGREVYPLVEGVFLVAHVRVIHQDDLIVRKLNEGRVSIPSREELHVCRHLQGSSPPRHIG